MEREPGDHFHRESGAVLTEAGHQVGLPVAGVPHVLLQVEQLAVSAPASLEKERDTDYLVVYSAEEVREGGQSSVVAKLRLLKRLEIQTRQTHPAYYDIACNTYRHTYKLEGENLANFYYPQVSTIKLEKFVILLEHESFLPSEVIYGIPT